MERKNTQNLILSILMIGIFLSIAYFITRFFIFFLAPIAWYDDIIGGLLLFAEFFIVFHGIGYAMEIFRVVLAHKTLSSSEHLIPSLKEFPSVSIVIPSYKEPIELLEKTLSSCYNLTYPNKKIILLDDTRYDMDPSFNEYRLAIEKLCERFQIALFRHKWRGAKAGILNDFLSFSQDKAKEGSTFLDYSKEKNPLSLEYLCIFDADQNPFPNFIEPLIEKMAQNSRLAFVQTPQYYTNFESNRVARAAGLQQVIFYEYICEGKSIKDAMFCCGTNVLFRIEALLDVGGFEEESVTEDFATSLNFLLKGWSTLYYDRVGAFGLGPENLSSYFKQQSRWSFGTLSLFKKILLEFITHPKKMALVKWWEFFLSGSHYFIGFVYLIVILCPILYLLFSIPSFFADYRIYMLIFFPYIFVTFSTFYWTLRKRGYKPLDMMMGQFLILITFPVYIKGAIKAFGGGKMKFEVTEKKKISSQSVTIIWPQFLMSTLIFIAVVWGVMRIYFEREPIAAFLVNILWSLYNFCILLTIFYFIKPQEDEKS